jgi:predicted transcriptional regulator
VNSDFTYISEPEVEFGHLADILAPDEWIKIIRHKYPKTDNNHLPRAVRWFVQMYERKRKESEVFARLSFASDADRRVAFSVWKLLVAQSRPMMLKEIAPELNLQEYAVSQILYDLIRNGFVVEHTDNEGRPDNEDGKRYSATD